MYEDSHTRMARTKELTVEDKLKYLYDLQQVDTKIDNLRTLAGELPQEVKDMADEVEGLKTRLTNIENEIKECETQISDHRVRTENANASISRYKEQQNSVRNNREFDNLSKEIEYQELEIQLCEKKIGEANTRIAERGEDVKKIEETIDDRKQALVEKNQELDEIMDETRTEEEKLKTKAKDLEGKIESRLLTSFKRIRKNARNGLGIVYVQRDACGGCFNKIPPQRQLDIKMHKKIIVCEYCGRILIDPELAGVKIDKPTEEKPKRKRAIRKKTTDDAAA
jgi:predicted  nucleic acid-binding Zn-ribbon protein